MLTLALAIKKVFGASNPIEIIGIRRGEKLYETLLTREQMCRAEDLGSCFRVPADNRDLNYNLYLTESKRELSEVADYNSQNTRRLDVDEMADMPMQLGIICAELAQMQSGLPTVSTDTLDALAALQNIIRRRS